MHLSFLDEFSTVKHMPQARKRLRSDAVSPAVLDTEPVLKHQEHIPAADLAGEVSWMCVSAHNKLTPLAVCCQALFIVQADLDHLPDVMQLIRDNFHSLSSLRSLIAAKMPSSPALTSRVFSLPAVQAFVKQECADLMDSVVCGALIASPL